MSEKTKKKDYKNFIFTHKKFLVLFVLIALSFVCVPHIYEQIKGEDATIALQLKDPNNTVNSKENPYILDCVDDFIILQEFSKNHDCYGMYFEVGETLKNTKYTGTDGEDQEASASGGTVYNLNLKGKLILKDESKVDFMGIGQNFQKPFRGNIMFKGITIWLDTPLFCFIGSGASIEEVNLLGNITPDKLNTIVGKNATVGTLASMAILDCKTESLDISNISVSNKTTVYGGPKPSGGLIGTVFGEPMSTTKDYKGDTIDNSTYYDINLDMITITDDVYVMSVGAGKTNYSTVSDKTKGTLSDDFTADSGGVIGSIVNTDNYVNVNFTGTTYVKGKIENNNNACGGVIGFVSSRVCVEFDGNVDVQGLTALTLGGTGNYAKSGYVIGSMNNNSLAYMTENHIIKRPVNDELAKSIEVGGRYASATGQIYKNTPKTVFERNKTVIDGKGTDESPYIIDSIDDMERLSAFLSSGGYYGSWYKETIKGSDDKNYAIYETWFDLPDTIEYTTNTNIFNHVRSATYSIEVDLDLTERGIEKLNRREAEAFQGSIIGKKGQYKDGNEYPTIYQNIDTWDKQLALIPYTYGNRVKATQTTPAYSKPLVFKDFRMEGKVSGAYSVYGLIYEYKNFNNASTECYSGIEFENIEMNLDLEAKEVNSSDLVGFIGIARFHDVNAEDLEDVLFLNFKNIRYGGRFSTNSSESVGYGAGLIGTLYASNNNMNSVNEGPGVRVNIENYDFSSPQICSISASTIRISATINKVGYNSNLGKKINNYVAGLNTSFYHKPVINLNNINIHDSVWTNGTNDLDVMGGVLGYTWDYCDVNINGLKLENIDYNLKNGFGYLLMYNVGGSRVKIDGLEYKNVNIYKLKNTANENAGISTMFGNAIASFVTISNYKVENSTFYLDWNKDRLTETVWDNNTYDGTYGTSTRGVFSFEGNDKDGKPYSAVNTIDKLFRYTDINDNTKDYSMNHWSGIESHVSYNLVSNMNGKSIKGVGTKDNPFIIDNEAELTMFSNLMSNYVSSLDYVVGYFTDIESILTTEEKSTLKWYEIKQKYYHRILTGYYVFASDMNLSEHSYYPANNCTGKYYGFNAYKYSNSIGNGSSLTDEQLRIYCSSAIMAIEDGVGANGITPEIVKNFKPEIHFAADKVAEGIRGNSIASATNGYSPTANYGMHLKLHGGLFGTISGYKGVNYTRGNVNIGNIKLSGVASGRLSRGGGFLISGYDYSAIKNANVNVSYIDFQDAMIIQGYNVGNNETTRADGLLIESVENSQVNVTGIKILADSNGNANIRASALIGYQTGTSSKVIFREIDLNAVIDQGVIKKDASGNIIVETTEKAENFRTLPTNTNVDTMTEEEKAQYDAFNKYGYGFRYGYYYYYLEAGAAIYYYDVDNEIVTPGRTAEEININTKVLSNDILLKQVEKYAYRKYNIDVNPQSANIIHGTGTKEDPYIIDNLGQLVTLSNFIKYKGDVIDYTSWYVGESKGTSYDKDIPSTWANESNLIYVNRLESEEVDNRIKSVEYLTKAHYKIAADIDFTNLNDYFAQAAESFSGIGIEDYPFSGSFVGQIKEDGTNPKIKIGNTSENYQKTFGLIQYAKGAKIMNIDICAGKKYKENINMITGKYSYVPTDMEARIYLSETNAQAGILINNIIGGDNIIDNVKISTTIQLKSTQNSNCYIGGYVGIMYKGTLTIGNMKKSTFENLRIGYVKLDAFVDTDYSNVKMNFTSAIVGDYYNGCIIIKDSKLDNKKVYVDTSRKVTTEEYDEVVNGETVKKLYNTVRVDEINYYNKYGIPCSLEYNPINYNYLEKMNTKENRIKVIKDERDEEEKTGSLICKINNADQLFLLSLATNSGALSAADDVSVYIPYMTKSSTQKYDEDFADWLANENANKTEDEKIRITEIYDMPMFFKYFDFTELDNSYKDVYDSGNSLLSTGLVAYLRNSKDKRTTWTLSNPDKNYVYDMSVYGSAFSGIGPKSEVYIWTDTNYNAHPSTSFNANFDGKGHTIKVDINKIGNAGLFTMLNASSDTNSSAPYIIGNFTLRGNVNQTNPKTSVSAGGVAGIIFYGYFDFKDITLAGLKVTSAGDYGIAGLVGYLRDWGYQFYAEGIKIGLEDEVDDSGNVITDNSVLVDASNTSSIVNAGGITSWTNVLKVKGVEITNTKIIGKGSVGGISGYINLRGSSYDTAIDDIKIKDTVLETTGVDGKGVGFICGYSTTSSATTLNYPMAVHNVIANDSKLIAPEGSVAGIIEGYHTNVALREVLKYEYNNITDEKGKEITSLWDCREENDTCTCILHNEFYELEKAEKLFGIDREATDSENKPLVKYAECLQTNFLSTIDANNDNKVDDLDLIPAEYDLVEDNKNRMDNVMLTWSSDNGTMESVINSLLSSLTGGTGLLNDKNNTRITVDVIPMQVKDGKVSRREDDTRFFEIFQNGGKFIISNNNKFDTFEKGETPATYSIVTIKYTVVGQNTYSNLTKFTETIQIPMFISNMINVEIYSKIMIGQEYDIDKMKDINLDFDYLQKTTKDSSYTIYTEYFYGANRIDFDEELYMNKGFRLYNASYPEIKKNTELTLIDLTFEDDPKLYYYTVEDDIKFIPLTEFKDEQGNKYKERDINNLSELPITKSYLSMYNRGTKWNKYDKGIEKYLLFVDCTKVKQGDGINDSQFSPFIIDGVADDQTEVFNKEVFYVNYRTYNTLSTYNGRQINFIEDSLEVQGEINKEKQLNVSVKYSDIADEIYWTDVKEFDYNNQNKYLEVAAYLKNDKGEKVMLPSGTRIMYPGSTTVYESVKNTSVIFYYKDGVKKDGYALMDKNGNTIETVEFTLDFTYAKMDKLPSGQYKVCFDLVRNTNKNYPMGDDIIDSIESDYISVTASAEYGFRLDTNGKDTLAFNLADIAEDQVSEVNFGAMINSTLPEELAEDKKAIIKFNLYKKDEDTGYFMQYKEDIDVDLSDIELEIVYNDSTNVFNLDKGEYEYTIEGISGVTEEGVPEDTVMAECKLRFPYDVDINNYKLQADLYIDGYKQASDFFIVNMSEISH